jgi:hypothetical protein
MSPPEETATNPPHQQSEWTEEDINAACESALWFDMSAPPELIAKYRGMHVAILGHEIIDGDCDFNELGRRIEARGDSIPMMRLLFRYIPTEEEALSRWW